MKAKGVDEVVKVKSMATQETGLNEALAAEGIAAYETDLAELIVQLADDMPSHILVPAIHRNRAEIREIFLARMGDAPPDLSDVPRELAMAARAHLRRKFLSAKVAISGANFGVADTGTLTVVESEGNGRMSASRSPETLITVMGIEKVVPTYTDLEVFLQLRSWRNTSRSVYVGTTFSIPMTVMSVSGSVRHMRPLPSDSTTVSVPVSATPKFAPLIATFAERNLRRRWARAAIASSRGTSDRSGGASPMRARKISRISARLRWIAGTRMCDGMSSASCTMSSARSVSYAAMPSAASASLSPVSCVAMDFTLTTSSTPFAFTRSATIRFASSASRAQCTTPPRATTLRSSSSRSSGRRAMTSVLIAEPASRSASQSGTSPTTAARLARMVDVACARLRRSCVFWSASRAASGNDPPQRSGVSGCGTSPNASDAAPAPAEVPCPPGRATSSGRVRAPRRTGRPRNVRLTGHPRASTGRPRRGRACPSWTRGSRRGAACGRPRGCATARRRCA